MAPHTWSTHPASSLRIGAGFRLDSFDTRSKPGFDGGKKAGKKARVKRGKELRLLQEMLFAQGRSGSNRSLLVVVQGMDTSGKGGIGRHVMGKVDPQGVHIRGFGVPTEEERQHHFLWRIEKALPPAGHIGVFDRSHYEDVLTVRANNLVTPDVWEGRYGEINEWERQLTDNGVSIVKIAMLVSKQEQLERLEKRLTRADKYWKYDPSDIDSRKNWDAYQEAYQAVFDRCHTAHAPWFAIPADRKWYARLAVTEIVIQALRDMDLSWPDPDFDVAREKERLRALRRDGD